MEAPAAILTNRLVGKRVADRRQTVSKFRAAAAVLRDPRQSRMARRIHWHR
jgi:hypothetical protein